ncbi:MAG: cysteine peptidase family C39 domain-containing protein [Candidatus Poribacteria bacterium]
MVLEYLGEEVTEEFLRRFLKTKYYGANLLNIRYLSDIGFRTTITDSSIEELKKLIKERELPIVRLITQDLDFYDFDGYHAVIIVGINQESVIANDPYFETEVIEIPIHNFTSAWAECDYLTIIIEKKE